MNIFVSVSASLHWHPNIISELSRTKVIFQDFPGLEILQKNNPGLSRRHGNPVHSSAVRVIQASQLKQYNTDSLATMLVMIKAHLHLFKQM